MEGSSKFYYKFVGLKIVQLILFCGVCSMMWDPFCQRAGRPRAKDEQTSINTVSKSCRIIRQMKQLDRIAP